MRGYDCYVLDSNFKATGHNACWSMIRSHLNSDVYIYGFDDPETICYQKRLIWLINKITPCSIVTYTSEQLKKKLSFFRRVIYLLTRKCPECLTIGRRYIKFRTLEDYDKSLLLLSFIRNLWHSPIAGYSKNFFEALSISRKHYEDPLARLTWANQQALSNVKSAYGSPGHSNVHVGCKVKTLEQFKAWKPTPMSYSNTSNFLTRG